MACLVGSVRRPQRVDAPCWGGDVLDFLEHDLGVECAIDIAYLPAAASFALSLASSRTAGVHGADQEGRFWFSAGAGEVPPPNNAKRPFRFAPVMYLDAALVYIDDMPQGSSFGDRDQVRRDECCPSVAVRSTGAACAFGWS